MTAHRNRYPGAQPFSDDEFSRKVFFGREHASRVLANKILANHMVTVYARSGLGKTSLLQAGVAPKLREDGFLPLFVRVNDTNIGPFRTLLETIPGEAERQNVEYVPGRTESLWSFFKTAEFWRDDLLLTPVLILDQFEELFTLQSEQARAHFLNELSYLTRGLRPPSEDETTPGELSEQPPAVNIVLSLREDYLGYLEEAAEHIPQILDARFRLAPLDLEAAQEAIIGPAAVTDPGLETRPFALDPAAVTAILDYLSHARTGTASTTRRYVEPFQLQLICRRMEQIADAQQKESPGDPSITMADLGGEAGLTQTLRNFYHEAVDTLPDRHTRRATRRLCEEYLISPEGRRLSLEENELRRQLGLPVETLDRLVASRLLRSENRSESTYYELSHDSLVEPILESRRTKAQVVGMLGIGSGALLFLPSLVALAATPFMVVSLAREPGEGNLLPAVIAGSVYAVLILVIVVASAILLRASARSLLRYRLAREPSITVPEIHRQGGFMTGLLALVGGAIVTMVGLAKFSEVGVIVFGPLGGWVRSVAHWLFVDAQADQMIRNWVRLDTVVYLVAAAATLLVGWRLCRWGIYRLAGIRRALVRGLPSAETGRNAGWYAGSNMLLGGIWLVSAAMLVGFGVLKVHCSQPASGSLPGWLPHAWFNRLAIDCEAGYPNGAGNELVVDLVFLVILLVVAIPTLRRGIVATRQVLARSSAGKAIAYPAPARDAPVHQNLQAS